MRQEVYFENIRNQIIQNLSSCKFELKIAVAWFTDKQIIKEGFHFRNLFKRKK